ncbi:MAG: choice-of-anchor I domain-containing protein, partial [Thermodesulfobacteriota bacterium]
MRFFSLLITFLIFSAVSNAEVILNPVGTFETGVFGQGAAEIVAYDTAAQRVFVINADASIVDVLDISDPSNPNKIFDINVTNDINPNGGINSVDVKNGLVAIAVENDNPTMDGFVAFYDTEGNFISFVNVGNLPDAVKFTEDGNKVVVANEGEQVGDGGDPELFVADPKGSISIIDVSSGAAAATAVTLDFTGFDGREAEFAAKGVKLQPGNLMSTELEPE